MFLQRKKRYSTWLQIKNTVKDGCLLKMRLSIQSKLIQFLSILKLARSSCFCYGSWKRLWYGRRRSRRTLSDDMALPGGQKQRVAIASAIAAACGSGQLGACFDSWSQIHRTVLWSYAQDKERRGGFVWAAEYGYLVSSGGMLCYIFHIQCQEAQWEINQYKNN